MEVESISCVIGNDTSHHEHPHIGRRERICTSYPTLIKRAQVCICSTASNGRNGVNRTLFGLLPRQVVSQ